MTSPYDTVEERKRRYSEELAAYTLRQWEIFHKHSTQSQALAEQHRQNCKSPPQSNRSRGGRSNRESTPPPHRTQIGKILGKWIKDR